VGTGVFTTSVGITVAVWLGTGLSIAVAGAGAGVLVASAARVFTCVATEVSFTAGCPAQPDKITAKKQTKKRGKDFFISPLYNLAILKQNPQPE
jgi:hypothetical protein